MTIKSIRILVRIDFPSGTMRLWDGAGPYLDPAGEIWKGVAMTEGLDRIESALNGEASTLIMALSGVDPQIGDLAYADMEAGEVIGTPLQILIQPCDEWDQPAGDAEIRFTGTIDDLLFDDSVAGDTPTSTISIEVTNRFSLRTMTSGAVLSDVDQKARSAKINPGANPDRFAERVVGLADKTIVWPRYS